MFQNIQDASASTEYKEEKRRLNIFSNILTKNNIILYILVLMVSTIGVGQDVSPFSIAIAAACIAGGIPILGVAAFGVAGNAIAFGTSGALNYMITLLVLIVTMFILKPVYNEENRNEKMKIAINVFLAVFLVQAVKLLISGFTLYDGLVGITMAIATVVFYKIFVNSIVVVQEFRERNAFSIEEVIRSKLAFSNCSRCNWRFFYIWIFYKKYFKYFYCNVSWMEKWIINRNNIRCSNWCNPRCYCRNRAYNDSSICNFWYDSWSVK